MNRFSLLPSSICWFQLYNPRLVRAVIVECCAYVRAYVCALLLVQCICQRSLTTSQETYWRKKVRNKTAPTQLYADWLCCSPCPRCSMLCCTKSCRVRADERSKLRNTDSFACMPTLDVGGARVWHICLLVFLLPCDVCVCLVVPIANLFPSTVVPNRWSVDWATDGTIRGCLVCFGWIRELVAGSIHVCD